MPPRVITAARHTDRISSKHVYHLPQALHYKMHWMDLPRELVTRLLLGTWARVTSPMREEQMMVALTVETGLMRELVRMKMNPRYAMFY